jgi:hypothetical protein
MDAFVSFVGTVSVAHKPQRDYGEEAAEVRFVEVRGTRSAQDGFVRVVLRIRRNDSPGREHPNDALAFGTQALPEVLT